QLRGGAGLLARRGEYQLQDAGPERRPVDAFARRREKHLLDQLADMLVAARRRGLTAPVMRVGERDRWQRAAHVATTRNCVVTTIGAPPGVCCGVSASPAVVCRIAGWPLTRPRAARPRHCARTQRGRVGA